VALFGAVLLLLTMGSFALEASYQETPEQIVDVRDEPHAVDYDENTTVVNSDAQRLQDDIVVRHEGQTLERGTDYSWDPDAGEISWNNTENTTAGETALVSYAYEDRARSTRLARPLQTDLVELLPWAALIVVPIGLLSIFALLLRSKPSNSMSR